MELNREQIVKALECFHQRILDTNLAKNIYEAEITAIIDALALISELTEENERLKGALKAEERHNELAMECAKKALSNAKADIVKEMQERLKAQYCDMCEYGGYDVHRTIDQIAKEMLEEE